MENLSYNVVENVRMHGTLITLSKVYFPDEESARKNLEARRAVYHKDTRDGVFKSYKPYLALVKQEREIVFTSLGFFQIPQ